MNLPARPDLAPPAAFDLPPTSGFTLDNGLRTTLVAAGSVPKAAVRLVVRAGAVNEAPGQTWLSRLVASYLKQGAGALDTEGLADAFAALGGGLNVSADDDSMTLRAHVLAEHAPEAVRLLASVAAAPRFPAGELARLQADLRREWLLDQSQPQVLALRRFRAVLYGDHPYGRVLPEEGTIDGFTVEAARGFWEANRGAARAQLYVAGLFDEAATSAAVRDAFAGWERGPEVAPATATPRSERAVHLVDRPGAEQSTLYLGLPVPDPRHDDYVALGVVNALLGGSFYSRITQNIREQKGYTYSPRSLVSVRRHDAFWVEVADVTTDVTGAALTEVFGEIERLRDEPPAEGELAGIQRYAAGTHLLRHATPPGILDQLAFLDLQGLGREFAERYVERAFAVTPAEAQRVTREYLRPDVMTLVVVGDASAIRGQLEPFGRVVE
ncbi:MAG: insulinase family protein [Dehalococcoidia bacterium]|nr:insulinase family protein [Dehalococcoidia bacterium]